jgi:nucleotide-binding universal stress UspA family protein
MAVRAAELRRRPAVAYRRILVPLVEDEDSETAVALAAELADEYGSTITAVVVVEVPPALPLDAHMLDEEAAAKRALEEARAIANARGVAMKTQIVRARVAGEAIVEEAARSQADVVVLRGPRSGRRWRLFGKTADYVLKHAPCRVLVDALPPRT